MNIYHTYRERGINKMGHSFEVITGPMSCGKTEELLRRVRRCIIAQKKVKVFSPDIDTRTKGDYIESRNGLWLDAITVKNAKEILSRVTPADEVIAIDEIQFFDKGIRTLFDKNNDKRTLEDRWNGTKKLLKNTCCMLVLQLILAIFVWIL